MFLFIGYHYYLCWNFSFNGKTFRKNISRALVDYEWNWFAPIYCLANCHHRGTFPRRNGDWRYRYPCKIGIRRNCAHGCRYFGPDSNGVSCSCIETDCQNTQHDHEDCKSCHRPKHSVLLCGPYGKSHFGGMAHICIPSHRKFLSPLKLVRCICVQIPPCCLCLAISVRFVSVISVQTVPLFNINSVPKLGVVVITKTWLFVVSGVASNRTLVMEYILCQSSGLGAPD